MDNPEFIELRELRDQQAATSEILRAISRMPTDLEPICQMILEKAAFLAEANLGAISLYLGGHEFLAIAGLGLSPEMTNHWRGRQYSVSRTQFREHGPWRALHIPDVKESEAYRQGHLNALVYDSMGFRTFLAVPLVAENRLVGTFTVGRNEVRSFTEKQIAILQTFADQAVVAIENARVLKALDERNKALTESLARQSATSEILRAISNSPSDLVPVFQLILEKSAQLADSGGICLWLREDNDLMRGVATFKIGPDWAAELMREPKPLPSFRKEEGSWRPFQVQDCRQTSLYRDKDPFWVRCCDIEGYRTLMFIPLVAKEQLVGTISVARQEVRVFTDAQLDLLKTFADQAVIAIENGRMFREIQTKNEELKWQASINPSFSPTCPMSCARR